MKKTNKFVSVPKRELYSKDYIISVLHKDKYFFDMRCWNKPKNQITKADIIEWVLGGCVPANTGHGVLCITEALTNSIMTVEEIAEELLKNKGNEMPNKLGQYADRSYNSSFFWWVGYNTDLHNFIQSQNSIIPLL